MTGTVSKAACLRSALVRLLHQHEAAGTLPTSARFLYYELIAQGIISKERTGARRTDQDMIAALTDLREEGIIPWDWIADETRQLESFTGSGTVAQDLLGYLHAACLDPWRGFQPMVLTESRSLAGVLRPVARRYAVRIASTNGQCAGFLHTDVAPALSEGDTVIYLGDWDFAGGHIEAHTRRVLEDEAGYLEWDRLAVTEEQVNTHGLTVISKYDKRTKSNHDAVETEALGQERIVALLRTRLDELLPEPIADVHVRAATQREEIRRLLS